MSNIDQDFVEYVVKSIVSQPDKVKVDRKIDEKGVLLTLEVDQEDLGRVIGKRGATAQSIRTLLRALGTKNDARYNLKIADNGEPKMSSGRSQGAWGSDDSSSSAKPADDAADASTSDDVVEPEEATESVADKARKELADLDDLDI
ncbi:KH domain-containing protein [Candidatus Saccharibacteria bacterium]|nr:KH domain-containing protein [Candidatus Saccharibacteria bacterium]MCB9821689.1 KH domain-containing protein [Candidatus Nomurabacteria bacterium]